MDPDYWHQKWSKNDIAFHNRNVHPLLIKHFPSLCLAEDGRIFLPLCGKTRDIAWLLERGHSVAAIELNESAIEQLFSELGVEPVVSLVGEMKHYGAESLDIFVGDFFALSRKFLGPVDAVYDRAALVALPSEMRHRYALHLCDLAADAPQLLITFEYDQGLMKGPPFSVDHDEVSLHYHSRYTTTLLERIEVRGGLKGVCPADEVVWLLHK